MTDFFGVAPGSATGQSADTSTQFQKPIVQFFTAETLSRKELVVRAVHCAPVCVRPNTFGGQRTARPT